MKQREIEARWGMPFLELAADIASNGLSMRDSARVVGMTYEHFRGLAQKAGIVSLFEPSYKLSRISVQMREPAWSVIARMADAGMTRKAVALALGYSWSRFNSMLSTYADKDPFPPWLKAANYVADSGESIVAASRRMALEGFTANGAAKVIGYSNGSALQEALASRGVVVEFKKIKAKPKPQKPPKEPARPNWTGPPGLGWRAQNEREYQRWKLENERV